MIVGEFTVKLVTVQLGTTTGVTVTVTERVIVAILVEADKVKLPVAVSGPVVAEPEERELETAGPESETLEHPVVLQVKVEVPMYATVVGLAEKEFITQFGAGVTVTEAFTEFPPFALIPFTEKKVFVASGPTVICPLGVRGVVEIPPP